MPFNIWCLGCNQHIGRGVRFNAEKKQVGTYYSTAIWSFRMKCHLCANWMEIRTDPKNSEYVVVEGARRKMEERSAAELGVKAPLSKEDASLMENSPFFRLEHKVLDERVAQVMVPKLSAIQTANERTWKDDYEQSRLVRRRFREEKSQMKEERSRTEALKSKLSIDLPLLPERAEDRMMARNVVSERRRDGEFIQEAAKRIKNDSIFGKKRALKKLSFQDDESITETLELAPGIRRAKKPI